MVRRLQAAGAVIVGKTNTCELGQWPFTSGPGFGHTRNPWSREHTPGGSSGGSAAAVAAGLVTAAIGSDGAGSVRIPGGLDPPGRHQAAAWRISTWPLREAFNGITVNGVLARTVADAALVLDAASGNVAGDLHQPRPVTLSDHVGLAPGRCASRCRRGSRSPCSRPDSPGDPRPRLDSVGGQLEQLGHTVVDGNPDYGLRLSWNFLSRSTSGLLDWAERLGEGVELRPPHAANMRIGRLLSQQMLRTARANEAEPASGGFDLPHRRRGAGADDRAAAAARAGFRRAQRDGDRPRDDRRLPGDLAVERVGLALDQRARRVHLRGLADRRATDGTGQQRAAADLPGRRIGGAGWLGGKQPAVWWNTGRDTPPVSQRAGAAITSTSSRQKPRRPSCLGSRCQFFATLTRRSR